jgi:hypothetical protein
VPPPPPLPPGDYSKTLTVWFSPRVLQWVPGVSLFLVFILLFSPWLGIYPGGVPYVTQNGFQALSGGYTEDPDLRDTLGKRGGFKMATEEELKANKDRDDKHKIKDNRPGFSVLLLFFILLLIPSLVIAVGSVVVPLLQVNVPPAVAQFMPWRFGIVAGLTAVLLLFLGLQLVLNFSLENRFKEYVNDNPDLKTENKNTVDLKRIEVARGTLLSSLERTFWLRLTVFLVLLALVSAVFVFWMSKRGEHRPMPKLELMW